MALFITSPWRRPTARLADAFLAEQERWPLWLQVLLALGMALYLALPEEPARFVGPAMVGALVCADWALRRRGYVFLVPLTLTALAVCILGRAGSWRPRGRSGHFGQNGASLADRHYYRGGNPAPRLAPVVRDSRIANRPNWPAPRLARLTLRYKHKPVPGVDDRVRLSAVLMPPTGPAGPGAVTPADLLNSGPISHDPAWFMAVPVAGPVTRWRRACPMARCWLPHPIGVTALPCSLGCAAGG